MLVHLTWETKTRANFGTVSIDSVTIRRPVMRLMLGVLLAILRSHLCGKTISTTFITLWMIGVIGICTNTKLSTIVLLIICLCSMLLILLIPSECRKRGNLLVLMVWTWRHSRMLVLDLQFIWVSCSIPFWAMVMFQNRFVILLLFLWGSQSQETWLM